MSRDPANTMFNIRGNIVPNLMRRKTTLGNWSPKAAENTKSYKPKQFTEDTKWMDWKESFIDLIRTHPGRNGVPINYDIIDNVQPINRNNAQLLDDCVDYAPIIR